jgi:tetratricopeptide (TPR) repeat protein
MRMTWLAVGGAVGLVVLITRLPVTRAAPPRLARPAPAEAIRPAANPVALSASVDDWVTSAAEGVRQDPKDAGAYRKLAIACMRKQRQCGDPDYYRRAEAAVRKSLELEPDSYDSRKILCWVLGGQHRFVEARALAKACIKQRPADPWNYGNLADAETELGNYPAAVAAVQQMIDLKPNLASYARAARQRELHGDPEGALEVLEMALDAGSPRDPESLAWCHVQKGQVRFNMGKPREADAEFARALERQPGYHLALAGRARCQAALGRRQEAVALYEKALSVIPRPDWAIALGDLKQAMGDGAGAARQYAVARAAIQAQLTGPDNDRQVALYLADHSGDPRTALELARRAARSRNDLYTHDALAWALYRSGRYAEAWQASLKARRLGTRDAQLLYHAAQIAARTPGHSAEARSLLRRALAINPYFDIRHSRSAASGGFTPSPCGRSGGGGTPRSGVGAG